MMDMYKEFLLHGIANHAGMQNVWSADLLIKIPAIIVKGLDDRVPVVLVHRSVSMTDLYSPTHPHMIASLVPIRSASSVIW